MGQLGEVVAIFAVVGKRPNRVPHPDHAVGCRGHDAGQQPGPPGSQCLAPGLLGDLATEIGGPVGNAARIAECVLPVGADRTGAAREFLQPPHVLVKPPVHGLAVSVAHQGLSCHRPVVGQVPAEFRAGGMQPVVRLVECAGRARPHRYPPEPFCHGRSGGARDAQWVWPTLWTILMARMVVRSKIVPTLMPVPGPTTTSRSPMTAYVCGSKIS